MPNSCSSIGFHHHHSNQHSITYMATMIVSPTTEASTNVGTDPVEPTTMLYLQLLVISHYHSFTHISRPHIPACHNCSNNHCLYVRCPNDSHDHTTSMYIVVKYFILITLIDDLYLTHHTHHSHAALHIGPSQHPNSQAFQ